MPTEPKLVVPRRLLIRLRDLAIELHEWREAITQARLVTDKLSRLEAEITSLRAQLVELVGEPAGEGEDRQSERPTPREGMPIVRKASGLMPKKTDPHQQAWTEPPKSEDESK
jgi:hypothetical protein